VAQNEAVEVYAPRIESKEINSSGGR